MDPLCSIAGCDKTPAVSLATRAFCREHFISACYERIAECADQLSGRQFSDTSVESIGSLLSECTGQVIGLALKANDLDNLERARLLDILSWAADLSRRLRRGPRKPGVVTVQLRRESPDSAWEEETETQVLSRHGALLRCRHRVGAGDTLTVVRTDTGRRVRARVVWYQQAEDQRFEVAIEFLNREDFWGVDWDNTEPYS